MSVTSAIIDRREPEWVRNLTFGCETVIVSELDYGDVWVVADDGTMIGVERKTSTDFLNSCHDERLWLQLKGLREKTSWAYLLITGQLESTPSGSTMTERGVTKWSWASVQGMILKAQELGVFVVHSTDDSDFEAAIVRLTSRSHDPKMTLKPARVPEVISPGEHLLSTMPGVGLQRAQDLIKYCGTPAWALTYLTDADFDKEVFGVARKTKEKARVALGLSDEYALSVVMRDGSAIAKWEGNHNE